MELHSTIRREMFTLSWTVNNFGELMDRKYELTSPIFKKKIASDISKWKMVVYSEHIYPVGPCVNLRLLRLSDDDNSHSVIFTVSTTDACGKNHSLKTGEKVFHHCSDFVECPIISNREIKEKCLLQNESLIINCKLDLLVCENEDHMIAKTSEESGDEYEELVKEINVSMGPFVNDLSHSISFKKSVDNEKNINALIGNNDSCQTCPEISSSKVHEGLEILSDNLSNLYHNTAEADVAINADDGKLRAHKLILTSCSDYFKQVLAQGKDDINLPGIDIYTLELILQYLYAGKLKQFENCCVLNFLNACKILNLPKLADMMQNLVKSKTTVSNATQIFLLAKEMKMDRLKNFVLKFFAEKHEEISQTPEWMHMMKMDPHSAGEVLLTVASFQNKLNSI